MIKSYHEETAVTTRAISLCPHVGAAPTLSFSDLYAGGSVSQEEWQ
jgi:hypothetical protein